MDVGGWMLSTYNIPSLVSTWHCQKLADYFQLKKLNFFSPEIIVALPLDIAMGNDLTDFFCT
jgi:hypothetical protein